MLILTAGMVRSMLHGREAATIEIVGRAYQAHQRGDTRVPQSVFLSLPIPGSRIIALPAFVDGDDPVAGVKWISSVVGNIAIGRPRATAVIVLNDTSTGEPTAILEGALISAWRTAASAAIAASHMHSGPAQGLGLIGCGRINYEIVRFMQVVFPGLQRLLLYDSSASRARNFAQRCVEEFPMLGPEIVAHAGSVLKGEQLVSIATTAAQPHIFSLDMCAPDTTILHVSLRDLSPELILRANNVTDDVEHVCRAETSLHLAERVTGNREFIHATVGDLIAGTPQVWDRSVRIFSPFGLGVLDLAVANGVVKRARDQGVGFMLPDFFG